MLRRSPIALTPDEIAAAVAASYAAQARDLAERAAERRLMRADARRDLRGTSTAMLRSDLVDCRRDLAPCHPNGRVRHLPPWWPASAVKAGMIRRVLGERGEEAL